MKIEEIRELSRVMNEAGLTALELTQNGATLRLEKSKAACGCETSVPTPSLPVAGTVPVREENAIPSVPAPADPIRGTAVASPLVGVFYPAPAPDAPPFVQMGSRVKTGDVLCIVEAMKLMNEITAECDGEVLEICAGAGDVVEYGQPLFRVG